MWLLSILLRSLHSFRSLKKRSFQNLLAVDSLLALFVRICFKTNYTSKKEQHLQLLEVRFQKFDFFFKIAIIRL